MQSIIQEIGEKWLKKICSRLYSEEICNLDQITDEILEDCRNTAIEITEAYLGELNAAIRRDKRFRREHGLSVKTHDRKRTVLTSLGEIHISRDYFYDRTAGRHCFILDDMIGLEKYDRVGKTVRMKLAKTAAYYSYARSAQIVTEGRVSRQTVRNSIMKVNVPDTPAAETKRQVKVLHVFADEDHVHLQKPGKEPGRRSQIVPLVTVTEGIRPVGTHRNRTIESTSFVDEEFNTKQLWKTVEGFIGARYDQEYLEKIVIHADGGQWIRSGLENIDNVIRVMDEFHYRKYLRKLISSFPERNVSTVMENAVRENDKAKADRFLQDLMNGADDTQGKEAKKFGKYLMNNWEEIVNRFQDKMPGSCTEGLVSHVLSERFSRDPQGWSKAGLGRLSGLRVFLLNGGKLSREDLESSDNGKEPQRISYTEYADKIIQEACLGAVDWSIFDGEPLVMDGGSGTQMLIRHYGQLS